MMNRGKKNAKINTEAVNNIACTFQFYKGFVLAVNTLILLPPTDLFTLTSICLPSV